jgi:hypothetical protein
LGWRSWFVLYSGCLDWTHWIYVFRRMGFLSLFPTTNSWYFREKNSLPLFNDWAYDFLWWNSYLSQHQVNYGSIIFPWHCQCRSSFDRLSLYAGIDTNRILSDGRYYVASCQLIKHNSFLHLFLLYF